MYSYNSEGNFGGRSVILHLNKGEGILECIGEALSRLDIDCAIVTSGIGSLRKVRYHRIANTNDEPANEFIELEGPIELLSLSGIVIKGEPHLHISCCDREKAFGGHCEPGCEVQFLAEISLVEIKDLDLKRSCGEYGITYIDSNK